MKLADMNPDDILAALEQRQDVYIDAADAEARAEAAHRAMEGAVYSALRAAGETVKDSEMAIRTNDNVKESLQDLFDKQRTAAKARAAVDRAKLASELYRTIRADQRRI